MLTRDIVAKLADPHPVVWAPLKKADMVSLGSLGELVLKKRLRRFFINRFKPLHVWGTGFLKYGAPTNSLFLKIHALRGKNSLTRLSQQGRDIALGDPGLLCSRLFPQAVSKRQKTILAIPHLHDKNYQTWVDAITALYPEYTVEVWSCDKPVEPTLKAIASAAMVVSSAMHPLITAHSYRTPCLWVELDDGTHAGKRYKFEDYYSVTGLPAQSACLGALQQHEENPEQLRQELDRQLLTSQMMPDKLESLQNDLIDAFGRMAEDMGLDTLYSDNEKLSSHAA